MTRPADRYAAYTDGELADVWNHSRYARAERALVADELRRRGYYPERRNGHALHVAVPEARRDRDGDDSARVTRLVEWFTA